MGNFIKKNWFVSLVVLMLCGVTLFYIVDTNKGKLKGKTANGEDVVYEINGKDITTSQYYDQLFQNSGISAVSTLFRQSVADQSVEVTDEITTFAKEQAEAIIQSYQTQYPTNYKEVLAEALQQSGYAGYEDLEKYLADYKKQEVMTVNYAKEHFDELQIRNVSYLLLKYENDTPNTTDTPTEDEKKRMDAVDAAFAAGDDFATVAKNFSEDASTAETGGVLGTIDNKVTTLDEDFLKAALALKEGEVSDWVHSANFGYFRIKNNASTYGSLVAFEKEQNQTEVLDTDPILSLTNGYDVNLPTRALFDAAEKVGFDFGENTEIYEAIRAYYGIDGE